ncbi:MAG TPA: carbohydrate binding domain-containing protein, partial [Armatimonadota bacterium]|nr:carbohydrate binding domain-containing protein [Armatimonadota bacterium]
NMPGFGKGVDNFYAPMLKLQHDYARDLLTHLNPYTKTRYVDEPAVAIIEINNENGLYREWAQGHLEDMPDPYQREFRQLWNAWLAKHYASTEAIRTAWGEREPIGAEMLKDGDFSDGFSAPWRLELNSGAEATATVANDGPQGEKAVTFHVTKSGGAVWHVQFQQGQLHFESGKPYTLTFWAKADGPSQLNVDARENHAPWMQCSSLNFAVSTAWKQYSYSFVSSITDDNARVGVSGLAARLGNYSFANFSLKPGGGIGLRDGESLGNIDVVRLSGACSGPKQKDWLSFIWDTETTYWSGMTSYLRNDLKAKPLIMGTAIGYSPSPIQAEMDIVDNHSYWMHPSFPGNPWDQENWLVGNTPMTNASDGGTLPSLAIGRVAGKPFTVTEYNHSAPNTYSSEAFLLSAAYGALQDWDGIFIFDYNCRRDDLNERKIPNIFDIDQHPTKMATLPAAAMLFRRGDVQTPKQSIVVAVSPQDIANTHRQSYTVNTYGVDWSYAMRLPVSVALGSKGKTKIPHGLTLTPQGKLQVSVNSELTWDTTVAQQGVMTANTDRSKMVIGSVLRGPFTLGNVCIAPKSNRQNWAAITMTVMEGKGFASKGKILVTATGDVENTNMKWKNADRTSVGRNWGTAPSVVEGIPAEITLPVAASRVQVWALDERGQRGQAVPVTDANGKAAFTISDQYHTLWYEVDIH